MQKTTKERVKKDVLNKGIEVMLPRGRRIEQPSWFDRTFYLLKSSVRVRIDIRRISNGN